MEMFRRDITYLQTASLKHCISVANTYNVLLFLLFSEYLKIQDSTEAKQHRGEKLARHLF